MKYFKINSYLSMEKKMICNMKNSAHFCLHCFSKSYAGKVSNKTAPTTSQRVITHKFNLIFILMFLFTGLLFSQGTPEWLWASQAGGTFVDHGYTVTSDESGNSFVAGWFYGTITVGETTLTTNGLGDIFVAKLNSEGDFLWAKSAGGIENDKAASIAVDSDGNCYVTGYYGSTATFEGLPSLISNGGSDLFIAKLDPNGNYIWAIGVGGSSNDSGDAIVLSEDGNGYMTGRFNESISFGTTSLTSSGDNDMFVAKFTSTGDFLWANKGGGTGSDFGDCIALDSSGNCLVGGAFNATATFGTTSLLSRGDDEIFLAKFDSLGNYLWAIRAGGDYYDTCYGIACDNAGNSFVTGAFTETADFGTTTLNSNGGTDVYVAKFDSEGNSLWSEAAGGASSDDYGNAIITDPSGNCYITGQFGGTMMFESESFTSNGDCDVFVAKLDSDGNFVWESSAGGISDDLGLGITINTDGDCIVTGSFYDYVSFGTDFTISDGYSDIFVAKLHETPIANYEDEIPSISSMLGNAYPNPFSARTSFEVDVKVGEASEVTIYNILGQAVKTYSVVSGSQTINWNGIDENNRTCGSGIYFYKLTTPSITQTKKLVLMK
jgi:hypothetical protein